MKNIFFCLLFLFTTSAFSATDFNHKSAIFKTITDSSVTKIESETFITFSNNINDSITAEWTRQETFGRVTNSLNLTKNGVISHLDLDTKKCTETDIKEMTDKINDPEKLAAQMKQSMNMKPNGTCEGEGYPGIKYTHSFGEACLYKDVFMLWVSAMGTTTRTTDIQFDVSLPEGKINLPAGTKCVPGPDLSQGFGGMMNYNQSNSASEQDNSTGLSNQQQNPPSQAETDEAMKQVNEMMKKFGDLFSQ